MFGNVGSDTSPLSANRRPVEAVEVAAGSTVSSESVGVLSHHDEVRELELSSIQLQVNDQVSPRSSLRLQLRLSRAHSSRVLLCIEDCDAVT